MLTYRALIAGISIAAWTGACGGENESPADVEGSSDTGTAVDGDVSDADSGAIDADTGANGDDTGTAPDVEQDTISDAGITCDEGKHVVHGGCVSEFSRVCFGDIDCREGEVCTYLPADNTRPEFGGHCILTPRPDRVCPGADGCAAAPGAPLRGAFGARPITPGRRREFQRRRQPALVYRRRA